MNPLIRNILVIAVRQAWPYLAGAASASASDSEVNQIVGALILFGSIAYHAWQRHHGRQGAEVAAVVD